MANLAEMRKILQDLRRNQLDVILRVETLEEKVASLMAGDGGSDITVPEPILTCVQCQEDYKESQNTEGYCKYHPSPLQFIGWDYVFECCNQKSKDRDSALAIPGCKKGKHCSEHHENYPYAAYTTFTRDTLMKACQVWLEIDVKDFIAVGCKWAEVGLSEDDKVYIACGEYKNKTNGFKILSMEQLKEYINGGSSVLLNKTGDAGWSIKASIIVSEGPVRAIEVSVKPSSSSRVTTKRVTLNLTGTIPTVESVQDMTDGGQKIVNVSDYVLPEDVTEGPVIDVGQDYSKDRKNDYTAETDDGCTLQIKQKGCTNVTSSQKAQDGKWDNLFTAVMMFTNTGDSDLAIINMEGYYCTTGNGLGEWVKCDDGWVGEQLRINKYNFYDTPNFNVKSAHTSTMAIQLCIKIEGDKPPSGPLAALADCSLPQPLHLKAVFTDYNERKASIRFEFGNSPLDLVTCEKRESRWNKGGGIYSYCFADNLENFKRSDAGVFFQVDDGILVYRPAIEGSEFHSYPIGPGMEEYIYKAKKAEKSEFGIEDFTKEKKGTEIRAYALVDLDNEIAYGFKMMIKTPTSLSITHCMLPQTPDPSELSLTISPERVMAGNEITIKWQVTRACKSDHIYVYTEYGKKQIEKMCVFNKKAELTGEVTMKAPLTAGVYETRYYPFAWSSTKTGRRHDVYWMKAKFTVFSCRE